MSSPINGRRRSRLVEIPEEAYLGFRRVVTQYHVVVDGVTYIVERARYEPRSLYAHVERRGSALMRRYMLSPPPPDESDSDHSSSPRRLSSPPESDHHRSKRARVSDAAVLGLQLQEARAGDEGLPPECAVCLRDFCARDTVRAMPCSIAHAFHQDCILRWLRVNPVCPLCRHALPTQQQDDDEDADYQQDDDEDDADYQQDDDEDDADYQQDDDEDDADYQQEIMPVPDEAQTWQQQDSTGSAA